jgi:hypothetical protein
MVVDRRNGRGQRPTRTVDHRATNDLGFPRALAEWTDRHGRLLKCLVTLRGLGSEGSAAVDAVLALPRVARLRASWSLWSAIAEGDGMDGESLLLCALPLSTLEAARFALFGPSWRDDLQACSGDSRPSRTLRTLTPVDSS